MAKKQITQKWYKLYEGVRCVLSIIPAKLRKVARLEAGDHIKFSYDEVTDLITIEIKRA